MLPFFDRPEQAHVTDSGQLWHLLVGLGGAVALFAARWLFNILLFKPAAKLAVLEQHESQAIKLPGKKVRDIERFSESFYKALCYSSLLAAGIYALHDQPWLFRTDRYWEHWHVQRIPLKMDIYYAAELAFYTCSIIMLVLWEERRKDFAPMMLHHLVSVALIVWSRLSGLARVGSAIMLLHDPSDIFLETAKLCNYAGWETSSVFLFVCLLVTWFGLRLVLLPIWIIPSIWSGLPAATGQPQPVAAFLALLLCVLVILHAYWFYLIAKIAVGTLSGELRDTRESDD